MAKFDVFIRFHNVEQGVAVVMESAEVDTRLFPVGSFSDTRYGTRESLWLNKVQFSVLDLGP